MNTDPARHLFWFITGHDFDDVQLYTELWGEYSNNTTLENLQELCDYFHITSDQMQQFFEDNEQHEP